jgi:hypothetical protein
LEPIVDTSKAGQVGTEVGQLQELRVVIRHEPTILGIVLQGVADGAAAYDATSPTYIIT